MKYLFLALLAVAFNANATYCPDGSLISSHPNGNCNYKPPTVTPVPTTQTQTQQQNQTASANATAGANAGATSQSKATGGNANSLATGGNSVANTGPSSSSADNRLGNVGNDSSSSSFKAFAISLPTPVFTPPLPSIADCPGANVTQDAIAVGWNFFSKAHGEVNTDNCSIIRVYNLYVEACRYESARQVLNKFNDKLLPGVQHPEDKYLDLSPQECAALKLPMKAPVAETINYLYSPTVAATCSRSDYAATGNNGKKAKQTSRKVQRQPAVKRVCP